MKTKQEKPYVIYKGKKYVRGFGLMVYNPKIHGFWKKNKKLLK